MQKESARSLTPRRKLDEANKENYSSYSNLPSLTSTENKADRKHSLLDLFRSKGVAISELGNGAVNFSNNIKAKKEFMKRMDEFDPDTLSPLRTAKRSTKMSNSPKPTKNAPASVSHAQNFATTSVESVDDKRQGQPLTTTTDRAANSTKSKKVQVKTKVKYKTAEEELKESIEYLEKLNGYQQLLEHRVRDEISSVQNDINVKESECKEWGDKLTAAELELTNMDAEYEQDVENLSQKMATMENEIKLLQQMAKENATTITDLESKVDERDRRIVTNTAHLDELVTNEELESKEVKDMEQHLANCQNEMNYYSNLYSQLETDLKENLECKKALNNELQELKGNIRVYCRVRPPAANDSKEDWEQPILKATGTTSLELKVPSSYLKSDNNKKEHKFNFEHVFDEATRQEEIFYELSQLVQSSLDGFNVCIFAYGQTGSGKTFTMEGDSTFTNKGMIPRSVDLIFTQIEYLKRFGWSYKVHVSFQEIYIEQVRDLITGAVETKGDITSNTAEQFYPLLKKAKDQRAVAETECNEHSSRSHSIFQLRLEGSQSNSQQATHGTLNLIDLAGSERLAHSKVEGERLKETQAINKSLTSLGDVITALANKEKHIPYRNSKLTFVLQNYLGGDSKTLIHYAHFALLRKSSLVRLALPRRISRHYKEVLLETIIGVNLAVDVELVCMYVYTIPDFAQKKGFGIKFNTKIMLKKSSEGAKKLVKRNLVRIVLGGVLLLILLVAGGILGILYGILNKILPHFVCILVVSLMICKALHFVCKVLTFPGSTWCWRRNVEFSYGKAMSRRMQEKIMQLTSLCQYMMDSSPSKCWPYNVDVFEIRKMIFSMCHLFNKQQRHNTLNSRQKVLAQNFEKLQRLLKETNVIRKTAGFVDIFPFWTVLKQQLDLSNTYSVMMLVFEDRNKGQQILDICLQMEKTLQNMTCHKSCLLAFHRWLTDDTLGTLDQVREELQTRYEGKRIKIQAARRVVLDCMLLPGRDLNNEPEDEEEMEDKQRVNTDDSVEVVENKEQARKFASPTIIFCNPNAGYYELMYYESEWIDFYISRGCNVFVWNYRGYGLSTGVPNPTNLKHDGETVVNFLRTEYGVKKIGVHGQSLGGLVVCHIAKQCNLDFVCADRTFSSLSRVAQFGFGKVAGKLFRWLTGWTDDNSQNFVDASCYKMITFDPKDEVIPVLGSLKYSINKRVVERLLGLNIKQSTTPKRKAFEFSPRGFSLLKLKFRRRFQGEGRGSVNHAPVEDYSELLTPNQANALYNSLKRLTEVYLEASKFDAQVLKRNRIRKAASPLAKMTSGINDLNKSAEGDSLNTSISSSVADKTLTDDLDEAAPINLPRHGLKERELNETAILETSSISILDDSKTLEEAIAEKVDIQREYPVSANTKKSYIHLLNAEDEHSEEVQKFMNKLFNLIGALEAGGLYLVDVLTARSYSFEAFREFLVNLEIWGSHSSLRSVKDEEPVAGSFQKQSIQHIITLDCKSRLQDFIRRWEKILRKCPKMKKELEANLIEDIHVVSNLFPTIYHKLNSLYKKNYPSDNQSEIFSPGSANSNHQGLILEPNNHAVHADFKTIGHLVPLSCGHNGTLKRTELLVFEYYFKHSNFTKF